MKKIILILITVFCVNWILPAQSIKVQAPNLVSVGEQFNVSFVVTSEDSPSSFNWQCSDEFRVIWGPQQGKSTSISIINGKKTKSSQTSFTYILEAKQAGSFSLPAAEAVVDGETLVSRRTSIEVVGEGQQAAQNGVPDNSATAAQAAPSRSSSSTDIFMCLHLSKTSVVVGETVMATLKLYQRANITGFEDAKFPDFEGFWASETQTPSNIEFVRENVRGEIYNAAVIRSWSLVAQSAGNIVIDPAELVCLVSVRVPHRSSGSILDDFFQDDYSTIRKRVSTSPITVKVNSLPAGAPASFCGGVGSFQMNASITKDSLKAHDAASLIVEIKGKGNTSLVEAPKINFPPDFEVYDVKSTDTAGGKTFEYPFIPRSHGSYVLGPVEFTYYDIASGKYVTLSSAEMPVKVARGEDNGNFGDQHVAAPAGQRDVRNLGNDIRYISTKVPAFHNKGNFFIAGKVFLLATILLIVLAVGVYVVSKKQASRRADVVGSKRSGATKMARKRLAAADSFLRQNLYSAFYEELHKALTGYVGDALNIDMSDMSKENISARLSEAGVQDGLCQEFIGLLDACEFARYAPSEGQQAMNEHYDKAVSVISALDGNMHKKKKGNGMKSALIVLLVCLPFASKASSPVDSLWLAGVEQYASENYFAAAKSWEQIVDSGVESPELYYNLGNARFKMKEYAKAIVSYKRALRLDPTYEDAKFNLEFAGSRCQDKVEEVPQFFLKIWAMKVVSLLPSNAWAIAFLILLAATLSMLLLFFLGNGARQKKTGFYAGIVLFLLAMMSLFSSISLKKAYTSENEAVVMVAVSSVKSSPGDSSMDLFVLHEGIVVEVIENVGAWVNIRLSDGRQGWVKSSDVTIL